MRGAHRRAAVAAALEVLLLLLQVWGASDTPKNKKKCF